MTDQQSPNMGPKPGQGTGGCLGLMVGLVLLALVSFALTAVGYFLAHAMGWA